jgi:hypothetical protein
LERRADLRLQEDAAAILARWEAMDEEIGHRKVATPAAEPMPYRPAQSTVDAFRLVATGGDVGHLKAWLAGRPKDAPFLLALLENPASC